MGLTNANDDFITESLAVVSSEDAEYGFLLIVLSLISDGSSMQRLLVVLETERSYFFLEYSLPTRAPRLRAAEH